MSLVLITKQKVFQKQPSLSLKTDHLSKIMMAQKVIETSPIILEIINIDGLPKIKSRY